MSNYKVSDRETSEFLQNISPAILLKIVWKYGPKDYVAHLSEQVEDAKILVLS